MTKILGTVFTRCHLIKSRETVRLIWRERKTSHRHCENYVTTTVSFYAIDVVNFPMGNGVAHIYSVEQMQEARKGFITNKG